jgi:hypothetical protein
MTELTSGERFIESSTEMGKLKSSVTKRVTEKYCIVDNGREVDVSLSRLKKNYRQQHVSAMVP